MRVAVACVYVLSIATVFLLHSSVRGADMCDSDKNAENQVILDKENETTIIYWTKRPRMICAWQITAPPGYRVVFEIWWGTKETFKSFNAQIYDGNSSSNELLFDSTNRNPLNRILVLFSSSESARAVLNTGNSTDNSSTFEVSAYAVAAARDCTRDKVFILNATSTIKNFTSPYYPLGYPLNSSCGFRIKASPGKFVMLELGKHWVEDKSIQIYDGEEELPENLLWEFNWNTIYLKPIVLFSYGQSLFVKFKSGSKPRNSAFRGFVARYSAVEPGYMCSSSNPGDSGVFNASYGIITTSGFPSNVPTKALDCVWSLTAPPGHVIKLDLDTISLDAKANSCPTLAVKNFPGFELQKFDPGLTCQSFLSETLVSDDGRKLQIHYNKPEYKDQRSVGFIGKYASIPLETTGSCSANHAGTVSLKGEAASFHSLNYPNKHPANLTCRWNITVPAGQIIELRFKDNGLDSYQQRWINIYNVLANQSRVVEKVYSFTNSDGQKRFYSASNNMLVEFKSTAETHGFVGTFIARKAAPKPYACSTHRTKYLKGIVEGKLASRGFPLSYPNNAYCRWNIEVPAQHIVNLTVLSLDLQPDSSCGRDFLSLIDVDENYKLKEMVRLCGKNVSQMIFQSTSNRMIVEFQSDATGRYMGFEAEFKAVLKPSKSVNGSGSGSKVLMIVLISVFSVLAVVALVILIVWMVKYKHCFAGQGSRDFNLLNINEPVKSNLYPS